MAATGDTGSVTLFMVVIAVALLACVGLVVDGTGRVRALQSADSAAQEAARAAGQAIAPANLVEGPTLQVDTAAAARAARSYLSTAGVRGTVVVTGQTIRVSTVATYDPVFLTMLGPMTLDGSATAQLTRGVTQETP